ncbi:chorismate mutase [Actinokineospora inagensis]|uniref:chorismate mutase n=1 Tax=Actinokineospora inagensis TaxID=103730 RepID=UPI000417B32A|nr:chorismate mutase [Actinokineospora inagensis]
MTDSTLTTKVDSGRQVIDSIDGTIIRLVRERQQAAAGVQQARVDAGEPRLHNAREISVLKRYSGELGKPGTALASAILTSCRGPRA